MHAQPRRGGPLDMLESRWNSDRGYLVRSLASRLTAASVMVWPTDTGNYGYRSWPRSQHPHRLMHPSRPFPRSTPDCHAQYTVLVSKSGARRRGGETRAGQARLARPLLTGPPWPSPRASVCRICLTRTSPFPRRSLSVPPDAGVPCHVHIASHVHGPGAGPGARGTWPSTAPCMWAAEGRIGHCQAGFERVADGRDAHS